MAIETNKNNASNPHKILLSLTTLFSHAWARIIIDKTKFQIEEIEVNINDTTKKIKREIKVPLVTVSGFG